MNYLAHYNRLIARGQNRTLNENTYYERHHIIPRSLGGSDAAENLVALTPEEHYTAHLLLVKIHKDNKTNYAKMLHSCNLMSGNSNIGRKNKYYGWTKRALSLLKKGNPVTDETRKKISDTVRTYYQNNSSHLKGKTLSAEHRQKCSLALKGRLVSQESCQKISLALKGRKRSDEQRKKFQGKNNPAYKEIPADAQNQMINEFMSGTSILDICQRYQLSESKINSILSENNINPTIRTCPHCGKSGQTSNMLRWHFNKCKKIVIKELTV